MAYTFPVYKWHLPKSPCSENCWKLDTHTGQLNEDFNDEDERDQRCEDFLGEARAVSNQEVALEHHHQRGYDHDPDACPQTHGHEIQVRTVTDLQSKAGYRSRQWCQGCSTNRYAIHQRNSYAQKQRPFNTWCYPWWKWRHKWSCTKFLPGRGLPQRWPVVQSCQVQAVVVLRTDWRSHHR